MRTEAGTREQKRALKAMPTRSDVWAPLFSRFSLGYLAVCLGLFWLTKSTWWLALAVPVVIVIVATTTQRVLSLLLLAESRRRLESRGIRCLVVYSESPVWEEHIRSQWLSRLGSRAVVLNWSHRSAWPGSLEARLFKRFIGSSGRNFNPAVLVFRGLRQPHVFRFYHAFHEAKHGRRQYLEAQEAELFGELGV